jgi:hypothetical protein
MVTVKNPQSPCLIFTSPFCQPDLTLEKACSEVPPSPKIPTIHWILYKKVPCHALFPENGYSQNHRKIPNSVSISRHQNRIHKKGWIPGSIPQSVLFPTRAFLRFLPSFPSAGRPYRNRSFAALRGYPNRFRLLQKGVSGCRKSNKVTSWRPKS